MKRQHKKRTHNDIGMSYRIVQLPHGHKNSRPTKEAVLRGMIRSIERGDGVLPMSWDIRWRWQNSKKKPWREASLADTIKAEVGRGTRGDGFSTLMLRRLHRDYRKIIGRELPSGIREATAKELEAIENDENDNAAQHSTKRRAKVSRSVSKLPRKKSKRRSAKKRKR